MAISVAWQTVGTFVAGTNGTVNTFYTVPSAGTVPYGTYARDLVINSGGPATLFVTFNATSTTCTSAASFAIPAGGSLILTQCQVPAGAVIGAGVANSGGTASASVGFATNVAYI